MRNERTVTVFELMERWRLGKTSVEVRLRERGFPKPVVKVRRKPREWSEQDIEKWERSNGVH